MSLQNTNLLIQGSHLPPTFKGTPDEFFQAILERMKIVSPSGTAFFVISDVMPSSNVGPWLKGGTQWWVFDSELKTYVPLDITASEKIWFQVSTTTPATAEPPLWLQIAADGNPVGWYWWNGATWVSFTALLDNSVTLPKLAKQPTGSLISFDGSQNAEAVSGGTPGQIPVIQADGRVKWVNSPVAPGTVNGLVGTSRDLIIKSHPGDEATQLDVDADSVILQSNAGDYTVAVNVVDLVDITVSGIGGLDTGSETASTWYYVWLISNGASNSPLLSTSATSPVLPSGYVFKALIGAVYNDSASDLITIYQSGQEIFIDPTSTASFPLAGPTLTDLDVSAIVPPIAKTAWGIARITGSNEAGRLIIGASSAGIEGPGGLTIASATDVGGDADVNGYFKVPIKVTQTISVSSEAAVTAGGVLKISGFTI